MICLGPKLSASCYTDSDQVHVCFWWSFLHGGQLSLIQAELESQWEAKCERTLASAKEQHVRQYQEVCEQRDSLQQQVSQLEEKVKDCSSLLKYNSK